MFRGLRSALTQGSKEKPDEAGLTLKPDQKSIGFMIRKLGEIGLLELVEHNETKLQLWKLAENLILDLFWQEFRQPTAVMTIILNYLATSSWMLIKNIKEFGPWKIIIAE